MFQIIFVFYIRDILLNISVEYSYDADGQSISEVHLFQNLRIFGWYGQVSLSTRSGVPNLHMYPSGTYALSGSTLDLRE